MNAKGGTHQDYDMSTWYSGGAKGYTDFSAYDDRK